jgi:hypothetical protein
VLEILQKHLEAPRSSCVVSTWIESLSKKEQDILEQIRTSNVTVFSDLYKDLSNSVELPFKITAFRSHMKGYCTCQSK